jgi:predicted GNAT family acetyltransferase
MRAIDFLSEELQGLTVEAQSTPTGGWVVSAYLDGNEIGWTRFQKTGSGKFKASMAFVSEKMRRQGVARAIYAYARQHLGLDIIPSDSQSSDAKAFWASGSAQLSEFTLGGADDGEDDTLFKYAKILYNGDIKTQQHVEQILHKAGFGIGENEDENGGAFITGPDGNYFSWVASDLEQDGMAENFADGRNPQDKGDSVRHGIPKKASLNTLDKIVHSKSASPRKKQLAHWQANMRRGRDK